MTDNRRRGWRGIAGHATVLILISQNPDTQLRDLAAMAGITEHSTQRITANSKRPDPQVGKREARWCEAVCNNAIGQVPQTLISHRNLARRYADHSTLLPLNGSTTTTTPIDRSGRRRLDGLV